jgi:PadR family transcriptional regulator AphA
MEHKRTAYVVLGILAIHDSQSGYEIRKTIEQSVGFFWGESYGQLYPTLKRLVAEGLVVAEGADTGARARRAYSITPAGREALKEWLAVPYRDDPPRDEFLLKLFFGDQAAPGVSVAHLQAFQEKNRRMLATLQELGKFGQARSSHYPGFKFWMLTLEFGVAQLRTSLEWSDAALAMLAAGEGVDSNQPAPGAPSSGNQPLAGEP